MAYNLISGDARKLLWQRNLYLYLDFCFFDLQTVLTCFTLEASLEDIPKVFVPLLQHYTRQKLANREYGIIHYLQHRALFLDVFSYLRTGIASVLETNYIYYNTTAMYCFYIIVLVSRLSNLAYVKG